MLNISQSINPYRNKKFNMSFKTLREEAEKHTKEVMKDNPKKMNDKLEFPESPGVYLIYKNKKVIYIGQSINLKGRFRKHLSKVSLSPPLDEPGIPPLQA
ncbi:unnamed protein product [marine sediment metagenome]|uniref:GIY-YIG domain-containing protein n=1 Tax=marine sediment metagenome TaxID=412755 RepID=X1D1A9_9ZZZZ